MIKFNTGQIYIGSRTSKVPPEQDTSYWGSPVTFKHLWEDASLEKEKYIVKVCKDVEEKIRIEPKLIKAAWEKYGDLCLNRHATPIFHPEVCRKSGLKAKELGTGIHALTPEELREFGKISGLKKIISFKLKSPSGEIVEGKNLREFCRNHDLNASILCGVLKGRVRSHKGWTSTIVTDSQLKNIKKFTLKSPTGEIVSGENINQFAKENNLSSQGLYSVLSGKRKSHKGWVLPETEIVEDTLYKEFILKSPSGEIVYGKNMSQFAKENNLTSQGLYNVLSGRQKIHRGWSLPETDENVRRGRKSKEFALKSPTGEIVYGKNVNQFAREHNLHSGALHTVINRKANHHKGWTLP